MMSTIKRKLRDSSLEPAVIHEKRPRLSSASPQPSIPESSDSLAYQTTGASKPVPFQQPTSLITFSYIPTPSPKTNKPDCRFEFGNASMKTFTMPPRNAKLSYGYDQWIRRPDEKGRLDSLLKAFRKSSEQSGFNTDVIGVVCWRGVMTKILTAPYASNGDRDGPWELNVMRLGNTLYLEEHLDDIKLRAKSSDAEHPRQRQNMYYGYSFESYCTADKSRAPSHPREPPGWGGVVDTNEQWCSVVKTKLGDTRIVLGGEVDCVEGGEPRIDKMIELKTSMRIRDERDRMRFESKLLKFYFQSFLLGIPRIVVGFRTPAGELTATESFSTLDLPRMVRGKPGGWDASVGLNWGDRILTWLKDRCRNRTDANDNSMDVWRLKFTPGSGVGLRLVSEEDRVDVESDAEVERIGFLPKWYLEGHAGMPVSRPSDLISAPSGWKI